MKTKKLLPILLLTIFSCNIFAQQPKGEVNKLNKAGKKEGLWITKDGGWRSETYYKNGLESGISKTFSPKGKLDIFGEYKSGIMTGTWYRFEDTGHLVYSFRDFTENKNSVIVDGNKFTPEFRCYIICYYTNGNIEREGSVLFFKEDAPDSDTAINYGEWKYYDESGKLIKTEILK